MKFHIALLVSLAALSSCGEGGGESVFLYFINAYNGAENVTIIGPTGPLVQSAGFGDRMGVDNTGASAVCPPGKQCIPMEYDRNLGGEFTAVVDGAPDTYDFSYPIFSLYPQETATMLFAGRSSDGNSIETHLVRHVQSISDGCVITFLNTLSLDNALTIEDQQFSVIPEFKLTSEQAYFVDERALPFPTKCGSITDTSNPKHIAVTRDILDKVNKNPWFFYSDCEENAPGQTQSICPVWVDPGTAERSAVYEDANVAATPNSIEYYECVQDAIKFGTDAMGEETCPPQAPVWADAQIDVVQLAECKRPKTKTASSIPPDESRLHIVTVGNGVLCEPTFRFRTSLLDAIFGPKDGSSAKGRHQKGDLLELTFEIGAGNEYFVALMGRPVNPLIWRWESGSSIANLNDFPYVNGKDGRIGKY